MISKKRLIMLFVSMILMCLMAGACSEKKEKIEGKVIITETEYILRQDRDWAFVLDARGKVKNVGTVDVKNLVITGYCRSCGLVIVAGRWYDNDQNVIPKTSEQKAVINYLPAGAEEEYSFREIAFYFSKEGPPLDDNRPEKLEVVVESFEVVDM